MWNARSKNPGIPLWLKIFVSLWIAAWAAYYVPRNNWTHLLWFCHVGNFIIVAGLWLESRIILSWQAVALVIVQLLYAIDVVGRAISGVHLIGGTEYIFDAQYDLSFRILSLYHVFLPLVLLWTVWRLGYDRRAILLQAVECWTLLLVCYFLSEPQANINWAFGTFETVQTWMAPWQHLLLMMLAIPACLYLPAHLVFCRWFADETEVTTGESDST